MPLNEFHPAVRKWFLETLGEPTAAQHQGWSAIAQRRHTLIAAPTGSGKTLAAFLTALDELFNEGLTTPLRDEVRVVYVSPLKALSADIHKNLAEPRRGIRAIAEEIGLDAPRITAAVRTGDTTSSERTAMLRTPPHILVTTPESLYLLLTAERSREMLRTVRTVIVDEIHAVIGTRRGAHLALTLERLQQVAATPLLRIGLSATQKPIDEVSRFLAGSSIAAGDVAIVDEGHRREMDLGLEMPRSPLDAVMSHEVWEEYYARLCELIEQHRTTLVFVNTRRMAERVARQLSDRLGEAAVTAHHGSLSKEKRLEAETRLKRGELKALVATASLELGIDIGSVDLVCQIGSPHRIATLLQRVGRSGHSVSGTPKGRVFPVSRDDLVECASLLRAVRRGELDRILTHDAPLDVLAQQLAAEAACAEYDESMLYALMRRAHPYRDLSRTTFDSVLAMLSEGYATRRGRRGALLHRDEVNGTVRGRRGARMLAITSGGAIPELADYRVVMEHDDTFVGTLNEDFAIESSAGDIFQLGNASWQVVQVASGVVRVADAHGAPPTIPFWLGEAPARSDELSRALSELRADISAMLTRGGRTLSSAGSRGGRTPSSAASRGGRTPSSASDLATIHAGEGARAPHASAHADPFASTHPGEGARAPQDVRSSEWLVAECGIPLDAAREIVAYLADARRTLGTLPTQENIVLERFFDESGGMQLVLHAPFGARVNKAWGLALRKRFCRQFNFELQAAATDDAVLLSLGPQHSFPLADVFRYLHPATTRDVLVQAFLDAPVFQTRWRWNATISLAIPRNRNGRKVAPPLQRAMADDLMAAVFPDAAACLENVAGDRKLPDHPLVNQAVRDCLEEAMDYEQLAAVLARIHDGSIECVARDTTEPSLLAHEILNAKPYAFLDDAPLEERRTQAVYTRRAGEASSAGDLGALDSAAIERVRDEVRPDPRDADELHDALLTAGFLTRRELAAVPSQLFDQLAAKRRAALLTIDRVSAAEPLIVAAERLPELLAIHPNATTSPTIEVPAARRERVWSRDEAIVELLRGRLAIVGPVAASALAEPLAIEVHEAERALVALENEGLVLRGAFTTLVPRGARETEWCDRRLLARIHRYTLNRLRAEIEPVSSADFMRFLFDWQHVAPRTQLSGIDGLRSAIEQLDGYEVAADAWEKHILPARIERYDSSLLDLLCLSGEAGWARLSAPSTTSGGDAARLVGATPVALYRRDDAELWHTLSERAADTPRGVGEVARLAYEFLRDRGASFARDLSSALTLTDSEVRHALGELVSAGAITSDGFAGLRTLVRPASSKPKGKNAADFAGRWSALPPAQPELRERAVELQAWALLRRYGVVSRRLLTREANAASWRELLRVYRRLEARGEIRGGRFVHGMSGEQYALPSAVQRLRELRREGTDGRLVVISAADPLNLTGILTIGERVRAVASNRICYRDGAPITVLEGDYLRTLTEVEETVASEAATILAGRRVPVSSGYVGRVVAS